MPGVRLRAEIGGSVSGCPLEEALGGPVAVVQHRIVYVDRFTTVRTFDGRVEWKWERTRERPPSRVQRAAGRLLLEAYWRLQERADAEALA